MKRLLIGLALFPAILACGPTTKPKLVAIDTTAYQMDRTATEIETALSATGAITAAKSREVYAILKPAALLGLDATHILMAWDDTQPIPPQMPDLIAAVMQLATTIAGVLPKDVGTEVAFENARRATARSTPEEQLVELDRLWQALLKQIDARVAALGGDEALRRR